MVGPQPSNARARRQNRPFSGPNRTAPRPDHGSPVSMIRRYDSDSGASGSQNLWKEWNGVRVKLFELTSSITARDLWKCLSEEGNIVHVDIFEDTRSALVIFSPPPARAFWEMRRYSIAISATETITAVVRFEGRKYPYLQQSPTNPAKHYPEWTTLPVQALSFGFMLNLDTITDMYEVKTKQTSQIFLRQNMLHHELQVEFTLELHDLSARNDSLQKGFPSKNIRNETYKFQIPFSRLRTVYQMPQDGDLFVLVIVLESPPKYFRRLSPLQSLTETSTYWNENDMWYRQTDIVDSPSSLKTLPLTLKKANPMLDLGRWTTYRLVLDVSKNKGDRGRLEDIKRALCDYNVNIVPFPGLKRVPRQQAGLWDLLDPPFLKHIAHTSALVDLKQKVALHLDFPVRYQLEVCLSQGYLNEHNISSDFIDRLKQMGAVQAQDLLEYAANQRKRVYEPMTLFEIKITSGAGARARIPSYCAFIRSATVTPTTVLFETPTIETSNRVIRQYSAHADRFLRVRFADEKVEGKIFATHKDTLNEVFTRVKRTMTNGITIGDRHYQFLAFGNSQFRENGAYFFAPIGQLTTQKIRTWMGMFAEIRVVAKFAARLGQCFSTTRAINGTRSTVEEIDDVTRNGFVFTDGVGKISPFLARLAALELGLIQANADPPSVFQFRLGGCKGVLAIDPESKPWQIQIRESQYKFPTMYEGLEIIRWSQFACANLNRQIILVLSALGVPDHVFIERLKTQLSDIEQAMTDSNKALAILQRDIDYNQMTLALAAMILDGFHTSGEPFLASLLQLWRAWSIKYLKEKARITISNGALLLGCVDETATLRGHFYDSPNVSASASTEEKVKHVPQVFVQLSKGPERQSKVITGPMILARNPSLHPGDIRVVSGVDVPQLHHLKDVVVLPQTGDRDVASMCSGGDLDGDDFLVIWDTDLLPHQWNHKPMDYSAPPPVEHEGDRITTDDITSFFVNYMKNDTLSTIATAHLGQADLQNNGVKDEKCLRLAALHSMAVDFVKTGQPAQMPRDLRPRKWPHFMEKKNKRDDQIYVSHKILGKLYDQVERVDFVPAFMAPFDVRILRAFEHKKEMLDDAIEIKEEYDAAIRRIMSQHDIKTEFEVWSTFVMDHSDIYNKFKFHERIGNVSLAVKEQFRGFCQKKAGGKDFEHLGPFVAAMYKVTSSEMEKAVQQCSQTRLENGRQVPIREMKPSSMPLMSFPWLFQDVLGKLANIRTPRINTIGRSPIIKMEQRGTEKPIQISAFLKQTSMSAEHDVDDLQTAQGITHRGELLTLRFDHSHGQQKPEEADSGAQQPNSPGAQKRYSIRDPNTPASDNTFLAINKVEERKMQVMKEETKTGDWQLQSEKKAGDEQGNSDPDDLLSGGISDADSDGESVILDSNKTAGQRLADLMNASA